MGQKGIKMLWWISRNNTSPVCGYHDYLGRYPKREKYGPRLSNYRNVGGVYKIIV